MATNDSIIWVHDYHLMMLGSMLRKLGLGCKLAFFQHIPFPPADIFEKLPWRSEILRSLFDFDVLGFQTHVTREILPVVVRRLLPDTELQPTQSSLAHIGERPVTIGSFPISIDFEEFSQEASLPGIADRAAEIRRDARVVKSFWVWTDWTTPREYRNGSRPFRISWQLRNVCTEELFWSRLWFPAGRISRSTVN